MRRLALVFDVGSTLVHPAGTTIRRVIGDTASECDNAKLELAFGLAMEADLCPLPPWSSAAKKGSRFLQLLDPARATNEPDSEQLWSALENLGGAGSTLYTVVDPLASETLERLSRQGHCLVAASNSDGTLKAELRELKLLQFFEHVVDSTDIDAVKPKARFFEHVLDLVAGDRCEEVWHIGNDLIRDVLAPLQWHRDLARYGQEAPVFLPQNKHIDGLSHCLYFHQLQLSELFYLV